MYRKETWVNGVPTSSTGLLFGLVAATILAKSITSIYLITRKWSGSMGIERARTSVVLYGVVIFVPLAALLIFVIPALLRNDESTPALFFSGWSPGASPRMPSSD